MKKTILAFTFISLMFALVACGGIGSTGTTTATSTSLSLEGQLLVGTIKLETTDLAVSSEQASQLLPLWETLQSLEASGTAATEEVQAVVDQIKSTMSAQQISGITAMKLTQQDLTTAVTENRASSTSSSTVSTSSSQVQPVNAAGAPGGGGPGSGNPPTDISSTGASSVGLAQAGSTQAVTGQTSGNSNQIPAALINALVELLKKKVG